MSTSLGSVVEALAEPGDPVPHIVRAVIELLGEADQARQVALSRQLALSKPFRRRLLPAVLAGKAPHFVRDRARRRPSEALQQLPRGVARQQRSALERNLRVAEGLLEVGRTRVEADEHRHLLERRARRVELADTLDDELPFRLAVSEAAQFRLGAGPMDLAQLLLGTAEPRREPVRKTEHLRRRAVVRLEPD